jgi:TolA-binding protein
MPSENQALLDAIRAVVKEELVPFSQGLDGLAGRVDTLTGRVDILTERVDVLTERIELRLTNLEARIQRLEDAIETLDTRTNQLSIDLRTLSDELLDLKERVKDGFGGVRRESEQAYLQNRQAPDRTAHAAKTHQSAGGSGNAVTTAPGAARSSAGQIIGDYRCIDKERARSDWIAPFLTYRYRPTPPAARPAASGPAEAARACRMSACRWPHPR